MFACTSCASRGGVAGVEDWPCPFVVRGVGIAVFVRRSRINRGERKTGVVEAEVGVPYDGNFFRDAGCTNDLLFGTKKAGPPCKRLYIPLYLPKSPNFLL